MTRLHAVLQVCVAFGTCSAMTSRVRADAQLKLRSTHNICELMGLGAVGTVPFNFPGADAQATARYRTGLNPGIVEDMLAVGRNASAPAILGGDLGAPFMHGDGKMYFVFGDSWFESSARLAGCPTPSSGCTATVGNDDLLASAEPYSALANSGCIALNVPRVPGSNDLMPLTWDGPANAGGNPLGVAVPAPGFSTGPYIFVVNTEIAPVCGATNNDCALANGLASDVCKVDSTGQARCYFGECGDGPDSPCALRFFPSTLLVRNQGTDFTRPTAGVHISSARVLAAYRGHFSALAFYSEVNFASNSGKVWVLGRDSYWGAPGITMSPYLMYHPVEQGRLEEPLFFAGLVDGQPKFSATASDAVPLYQETALITQHNSLMFEPAADGGTWFMLYGGHVQPVQRANLGLFVQPVVDAMFYAQDAGIYLRSAKAPWGPWSDAITVYNPFEPGQGGYCEQMYFEDREQKTGFTCPAEAIDRNRALNRVPYLGAGGEYGAAIVPGAADFTDGHVKLRWLLSTYNPYRVLLQESELALREACRKPQH